MSDKKHRPLFVTLEGGEGTGKSTVIQRLSDDLRKMGYQVLATREPGGSKLGEQIRIWLLHQAPNVKVGDYAELLLFLAARTQHLEEIILPALEKGMVVLCDRFNDSSIAYQGAARGLGVEEVEKQCELACRGVAPDMTLFMDVDPKIGLERTRKTVKASASEGEVDRIESEELHFHEKVLHAMRDLAKKYPERIKTIDAAQPLESMYADCLEQVLAVLKT
ncbi:MAG: dTMP kinase [Chlamydiota bacterium]